MEHTASPPDRQVLTVDEAAVLLRVSRFTLYAEIKRGRIPGVVRVGRTIRLSRGALAAWFEGKPEGKPAHVGPATTLEGRAG
jgi:excisionase family DNA binding protein